MSILVTTAGKYGDTIWSLATARLLSYEAGQAVDFAIPNRNRSLLPLLHNQSYLARCFAVSDWEYDVGITTKAAKLWQPPMYVGYGYSEVWHLGWKYEDFLDAGMPLIDFIAHQQMLRFEKNPLPFVEVAEYNPKEITVAYAFDPTQATYYAHLEQRVWDQEFNVQFLDVTRLGWLEAGAAIKAALCFVGYRSANYALAHAVGQRVICYEPEPGRLHSVFGCPYGLEYGLHGAELEEQIDFAAKLIVEWIREREVTSRKEAVPMGTSQ